MGDLFSKNVGGADTADKSGNVLQTYDNYVPNIHKGIDDYTNAGNLSDQQIAHLLDVQSGKAPSLAETQLVNATQRNAQANAAATASQTGINPALAQRQILNTTAGLNQAEAGQAAENRIKESQGIDSLLASIISGRMGAGTNLYNTAANAQNAQNNTLVGNQALDSSADAATKDRALRFAGTGVQTAGTVATGIATGGGGGGRGGPPTNGNGDYSVGGHDWGADKTFGGAPAGTSSGPAIPRGYAHGGEVDHEAKFLDAYRTAHGQDPRKSTEMLLAFHAGRKSVENMTDGGDVGGPAPVVEGDDLRNDQTPAMLTEKEHVIPRSVATDPDNAMLMEAIRKKEKQARSLKESPAHLLGAR